METTVRIADQREREAVASFLRGAAYGGGVLPSDRLVIAESATGMVGAYRLAREEGVVVLRGMRVREDVRRQGIGSLLLRALEQLDEPCFCVPHAYLEDFYGAAGFDRLQTAEIPAFLEARRTAYRKQGLEVIVMRREPEASGAPA